MPDIGSTLREARMRARIDISEVETATKIRAKYLRAIENEEWDLLPGPIYVKSFLKTYGDYLGLDSRMLIDEFRRRYERPSDHDLRPMASLRRERERAARGPLIPSWAIVGLILVVVVGALYLIGRGSSNPSKPSPTGAGASVPRHPRGRRGAHAPARSAKLVAHRPRSVRLKLVATAASGVYICVEDRAGHKLVPGLTYLPGQPVPVVRSRELFVTLGNNGVQMNVNGHTVPVAASSTAIGLLVTAHGVRPLAPGHAPTCA